MKFVIGDKVKVRKDLKNGHCGIDNLEDYQNDKVFTIEQGIGNVYNLLEDKAGYYFSEEMLILVEEKIILKAIKNKQGIYEIKLPKEIKIYSYGGNGDYDYIKCIKKEEILDDAEKEYLSAVIKPFRDRVKYIEKNLDDDREYISITVNNDWLCFPYFKKGTMYKNMEINKRYSLKELDL